MRQLRSGVLPDLQPSEPHVERPRQARSLATRNELLDSSRILFGTVGYHATTVKDITAHADLAVGAFYKHFRSKRHVLLVLMEDLLERIGSIDLRPPRTRMLHAALRAHLDDIFRDDVHCFHVIRAWQEGVVTDGELAKLDAQVIAWSQRNIERLFSHLLTLPNARERRDVPAMASLINRYMWALLGRAATIGAEEFDQQMRTIADLLYHYMYHDS